MINEFLDVAQRLKPFGEALAEHQAQHLWIKPVSKATLYVVRLAPDAAIEAIEQRPVSAERLYTIAPDNLHSFPRLNIAPLDDDKSESTNVRRIERSIDFAVTTILPLVVNASEATFSMRAVIERLRDRMWLARDLLDSLRQTQGVDLKKPLQLYFDVADSMAFDYVVADQEMSRLWSAVLSGVEEEGRIGRCCVSGMEDSLPSKMPNPVLPVLGQTYLMSSNADTPCQARYGRSSTEIFPIGAMAIGRANAALALLTSPERKSVTWGTFGGKDDLILAYLEDAPGLGAPLVPIITGDVEGDGETAQAVYEARTKRVFDAVTNLKRGEDSACRVLVLHRVDDGRKQVQFSATYSVRNIFRARDAWIAGVTNLPPLPFPSLRAPSLREALVSLRRQWIRGGTEIVDVKGVEIGAVIDLYLRGDSGGNILKRYLSLTGSLVAQVSHSRTRSERLLANVEREARVAVALYGILLYQQNRLKDQYMTSRDYFLGQFFARADRLHHLYCEGNGTSAPPQLIGNVAFASACESPKRALDVLASRLPVYLAWAQRYQGAGAGKVRGAYYDLRRLAAELSETDLAPAATVNGKAEMLLGYLAWRQKAETQLPEAAAEDAETKGSETK